MGGTLPQLEAGKHGLEQSQGKTPNPEGQSELKEGFWPNGKGVEDWSGEAC